MMYVYRGIPGCLGHVEMRALGITISPPVMRIITGEHTAPKLVPKHRGVVSFLGPSPVLLTMYHYMLPRISREEYESRQPRTCSTSYVLEQTKHGIPPRSTHAAKSTEARAPRSSRDCMLRKPSPRTLACRDIESVEIGYVQL